MFDGQISCLETNLGMKLCSLSIYFQNCGFTFLYFLSKNYYILHLNITIFNYISRSLNKKKYNTQN